jgi:Protein of unknown function (DUF3617)
MRKIFLGLAVCSSIFITNLNAAELELKPGLWQITTTSDLLQLAPHIPADQMQNIKDLANEYGLEMPQIENGAAISQACISKAMSVQKKLPNFYQSQLGCSTKNSNRNGNSYKVDFICTSNELKGNGTAIGTLTSAETFTGQSHFVGEAQGNQVNEKAEFVAKWLNESCGNVSPL